jgi:hypothetical protein
MINNYEMLAHGEKQSLPPPSPPLKQHHTNFYNSNDSAVYILKIFESSISSFVPGSLKILGMQQNKLRNVHTHAQGLITQDV